MRFLAIFSGVSLMEINFFNRGDEYFIFLTKKINPDFVSTIVYK